MIDDEENVFARGRRSGGRGGRIDEAKRRVAARGRKTMRRIGVVLVALTFASATAGADDSSTCMSAMSAPDNALDAVVRSCTDVLPRLADVGGQARALRFRGWALERRGDLQQALADFDRALEITPDDAWSLQGRARVNRALGRIEEARSDYERLLALHRGDTRWRVALEQLGVTPPVRAPAPDAATPPTATRATKSEPPAPPPVIEVAPPAPSGPAAKAPPPDAATLAHRLLQGLGLVDSDPEPAPAQPTPAPVARDAPAATPEAPPPEPTPQPAAPTPLAPTAAPAVAAAPPPPDPAALVRRLQIALRGLGYAIEAANGLLGRQTREAMDAFAADFGLQFRDPPDEALVAIAEEALRERRQQAAVRQRELNRRAQQALVALGYDLGTVDGVFGQRSRRALDSWAGRQGRPRPAEIDEALVAELDRAVRVQLPPAPPQPENSAPAVAAVTPEPPRAPEDQAVAALSPQPPPLPPARTTTVAGQRRVALVIGNSAYRNTEPLRNPRRDAEDMAQALREVGFEVVEGYDLEREAMEDAAAGFSRLAETADLALTYYSGHGLQFDGVNFLVPVDARVEDRRDLRKLVRLDQLVDDTGTAQRAVVVIDACRNNPFRAVLARGQRRLGLAPPEAPPGTLIAYATASGSIASDGYEDNSPYVGALLRRLRSPDLEIRHMFGQVQDDVARATDNAQVPTLWDSLGGEQIFLVPKPIEPAGLALAELTPAEVRALQRSLGWLGFWTGAEDGEVSPGLSVAVARWQGLPAGPAEVGARLTPSQLVALHRSAIRYRPPEALPEFNSDEIVLRSGMGEADAQRLMGMILDPAFAAGGRAKSPAFARAFYERAASQGDPVAAARLGLMLAAGGSAAQLAEARPWLDRAARAGQASAVLRLAELLLEEQGDEADRTRALALLNQAAASPDTSGIANAFLRSQGAPVVR
jgi:tetratricopeptide (TPR) repeat protein